jgi:hypothetical protein
MRKGGERRRRAKEVKGREKSRDDAGDKGMRMDGTGDPLSQILDTPLTVYSVHRTADAARLMSAE